MQQLLSNILKKLKGLLTPSSIGGGLVVLLVILWVNSTMVSANVFPIVVSVNVDHLSFGTVFPGETQEGNFIVTYATTSVNIRYSIVQQRKLLPSGHPEYPNGGDPAMPGYYRNLCPFLTKSSVDEEGDIESEASVGPSDLSDTWVIYFEVPAIFGNVAQNHIGEVIAEGGEYGCDISVNILE